MRTRGLGSTSVRVTEFGFGGAPWAICTGRSTTTPRRGGGLRFPGGRPLLRHRPALRPWSVRAAARRALPAGAARTSSCRPRSAGCSRPTPRRPVPTLPLLASTSRTLCAAVRLQRRRRTPQPGGQPAATGLDRIDIVYVHDPDDHLDQAVEEAIPALIAWREQGIVGAIGVGMNDWQAPLRVVERDRLDVVMLAGRWTLLDRSGRPLLDDAQTGACGGRRSTVQLGAARPVSPAVGRHLRLWPPAPAWSGRQPCSPRRASVWRRLPAAALQFPLRHPAVAAVVAGVRGPGQAAERWHR